jgi:hypothetical protein
MKIETIFNIEKIIILFILSIFYLPIKAGSQPANIPCNKQRYYINSTIFNGDKGQSKQVLPVFRDIIQIQNASWLKLVFDKCELGQGSYIEVTSLEDGSQQHLNTNSLKQWKNSTAFFNGNAVQVELFLSKNDQGVYFDLNDVIFGESEETSNILSKTTGDPCNQVGICDDIDDRVSSSDPAIGRLMAYSDEANYLCICTGWIASNGAHLTASHCIENKHSISLHFNVPASDDDGEPNFSHPNDQYAMNMESLINLPGSGWDGEDWAIFYCYSNSNTGLLPVEAQASFYRPTNFFISSQVRITGFGIDECPVGSTGNRNVDNVTQQTDVYKYENAHWYPTVTHFHSDARPGNSGSPQILAVYWFEDTDMSGGILTDIDPIGGCIKAGPNFRENTEFENALNTFPGDNIKYADIGYRKTWHYETRDEDGTVFNPYDTIIEAVNALSSGETLCIVSGAYNESVTINKAMNIIAPSGTATIGGGMLKVINQENDKNLEDSDHNLSNNLIPKKYELYQNFPNPFNPITSIKYDLPDASLVILRIYNILGKEIRTLVNEYQTSGSKFIIWDGKNNEGDMLSTGTYEIKLETDQFSKTIKCLYLK